MEQLLLILSQLGLGLMTNGMYDFLKNKLIKSEINLESIEQELKDFIKLNNIDITAETVIEALAKNGIIEINGSKLFAKNEIIFGSTGVGKASFGNGSIMSTERTSIVAGIGAKMETNGNAMVKQNPDGSISFLIGK